MHALALSCTHLHTPTLARNLTHTSAQSRSLLLLLQNAPYTIFCIVLLSKSERNPAILKCTLYCILFYSYQKVREILLSWNAPYTVFSFFSYQKVREILLSPNAPYTEIPKMSKIGPDQTKKFFKALVIKK